jgi:hypothetical protein
MFTAVFWVLQIVFSLQSAALLTLFWALNLLSVLSLVCPAALGRFSKQTIFSLHLRARRRRSAALLIQRAYTHRLNPPIIKEETPFLKHVNV